MEAETLWRAASALARRHAARHGAIGKQGARPLPPLLFFTDPERTPDPVAVAERLPPGSGMVFRHFGASDRGAIASALAATARRRGLILLIGDDDVLAVDVGAHGIHLPERRLSDAPRLRARRPLWLITGAAHSARALAAAARARLDAAVLSPVFPSRSPSAGKPLGPIRTASLVGQAGVPVYLLGGIKRINAARLAGSGAAGLAAVDALSLSST